jgi:hypothetical protein
MSNSPSNPTSLILNIITGDMVRRRFPRVTINVSTYPSTSGTTSNISGPNTHPTTISAIRAGQFISSANAPKNHKQNNNNPTHSTSTISSILENIIRKIYRMV